MRLAMMLIRVFTVAITLVSAIAAQEAGSPAIPNQEPAPAPALLTGQRAPHDPLSEHTTANYVTGGITISQMFTDNALLTTTDQTSDLSYDMEPHIAITHSATRLSYDLAADAGFIVNRTLSDQNRSNESGTLDVSYRLGQFTALRLSDSFMNTNGLWSGSQPGISSGPGIGPVQQPNSALFTYGHFMTNTALAELTWQFSAVDSAGIRATHSVDWFPSGADSPLIGTLYGGQTYAPEAFYNRRLSARQWFGLTARAERFDTSGPVGRTDTANMLLMYGINIRPTTTISFFGGPELAMTSLPKEPTSQPSSFPRRGWYPSAGAVFNWQGRRTSVVTSFSHSISDGAGLASAVTSDSASAELIRQLGRSFEIGPVFQFSNSEPIVGTLTFRTYSELLQFSYQIHSRYQFSGGYAREDQSASAASGNISTNRVWIGFSLGFLRPLGR
jgi:hypothetical protein